MMSHTGAIYAMVKISYNLLAAKIDFHLSKAHTHYVQAIDGITR